MKAVRCIITSESLAINNVTVALDPPLTVEEFADEIKLLRGPSEKVNEQWLKELGGRLFQRVFTDTAMDQYRSSDPAALALEVSDDLPILPWELLHDGANWAARTRGVLRAVATEQASPEIIPKSGALRVLAVIAGPLLHHDECLPDDDPRQPRPIDVKAHAEVFRQLEGAQFPAEIKLRKHVTREIFPREVSEDHHILHFVGHGNVGRLLFETRQGIADLADEDWIREQIAVALRGGVKLVIINSCFSADASGEMPGVAATILEAGVPAVIAMQGSVSESADIAFVKNLYGDLAKGKAIDEAVMNARRAMATDRQIYPWEWATPVLFINVGSAGILPAESLLEEETSLCLMDAEMAGMMSEPKVNIIEPPKPPLDPMMTRDEKFVGRRRELSDVLRSLDPDAGRMPALPAQTVCLHGDAGMGKTAIAIEAVHRMAEWFDDLIWLSGRDAPPDELKEHVKGYDPLARITSAEGFLTSLAHKCGIELASDEDSLQIRNAILRNLRDNRRKLLVLDSMERFARSELIRSLLTNLPDNCKAFITSRESLEINEKPIHVGPMNNKDSKHLVRAYGALKGLKADSRELGEIIRHTGGNPMAMRLVVSQVATSEKTLDDALEDLRNAEGEIFDYIFKRSLSLAGSDGRKIFAAMSVFFPTASRKALQHVCGLGEVEFEKAIKRVVGLSLVEQYGQGKRFGLHQLARAKSQQQLEGDSDAENYRERAARFFMDFVNATAPMTDPVIAVQALSEQMPAGALGKQMIQDAAMEILVKPAIENLGAELANCLLALEWAFGSGDLDSAKKLLRWLGEFIIARGYWDIAAYHWQRMVEELRIHGNEHVEAIALRDLAVIRNRQGRWKDAVVYYKKALRVARKYQDRKLEETILNGMGIVYQEQNDCDEAINCLDCSLGIARELKDEAMEGRILGNLGLVYQRIGHWDKGIQYFKASREIFIRLNERHAEAGVLVNLGNCYQIRQQYEKAMECYQSSLKAYIDVGRKAEQPRVLNGLGMLQQNLGDIGQAMKYYQEALQIEFEIGDRAGQRTTLGNIALVHSMQEQWLEAASACFESFQIAVQIYPTVVMDSLRNILEVSKNMLKSGEFAIPMQLVQQVSDHQLSQVVQSTQADDVEMLGALLISHGVFKIIEFMAMCEGDKESDAYKEALVLARSLDENTGAALGLVEWMEGL